MVNYHDSVTMAREYSKYAFLSGFSGLQQRSSIYSAFSIAAMLRLWHVVNGIFMSVSISSLVGL
jgi:hypothetical protein